MLQEAEPDAPPRIHWVINPRSGGYAGRRLEQQLAESLNVPKEQIYTLKKFQDAPPEHFLRLPDIVVIAGGDGTFSQIASKMLGDFPPLVFLPLGTGNDLGRFSGSKRLSGKVDPEYVARECKFARQERLTFWRIEGNGSERFFPLQFCNYFSFGFDAKVISVFEVFRRHHQWVPRVFGKNGNRLLYLLAALACLRTASLKGLSLSAGSSEERTPLARARSLFFANIQQVMGVGKSSTLSDPSDEKLEALLVRSLLDYIRMVVPPAKGSVDFASTTFQVTGLEPHLRVQADGEVYKISDSTQLTIKSVGSVNMFCW